MHRATRFQQYILLQRDTPAAFMYKNQNRFLFILNCSVYASIRSKKFSVSYLYFFLHYPNVEIPIRCGYIILYFHIPNIESPGYEFLRQIYKSCTVFYYHLYNSCNTYTTTSIWFMLPVPRYFICVVLNRRINKIVYYTTIRKT